ncbi:MAG: bifunctional phosphoglucose/phosphomannose isomerase [Patescibacteria group bacterium]
MMNEAINNFAKQFEYQPEIVNADKLQKKSKFIVTGMGGSHLAADLLKTWDPSLPLMVHCNYSLPALSDKELKDVAIIASSYSGNTEEVISGYQEAVKNELSVISIAVGGELLELAKENGTPYIQMPDTDVQPRSALGFSMMAHLKAMNNENGLKEAHKLAALIDPPALEEEGKTLANKFKGKVPIIYTSARNRSIAYIWKIKLNETGKIPAFYNIFPELNHNEINGFDVKEVTKSLYQNFQFVFIKDDEDHPRIQRRMAITEKIYTDRGLPVEVIKLEGSSKFEKIFRNIVIGDWLAYHTAEQYGLESEQVPMVEELKKLMAE